MSTVTLSQDADGTLVRGSARGDGVAEIIKPSGFRWGRSIGCWYFPRNRRVLTLPELEQLAERIRSAGHTVELDLVEHSAAEREAARTDRIGDRQEALADKAERKHAETAELDARAQQLRDIVPFGQPILVGHHSERRHRRLLERTNRIDRQASEAYQGAREAERKEAASVANQRHRERVGTTRRRIDRLGAELRRLERSLTPCVTSGRKIKPGHDGKEVTCPRCYQRVTITACAVPDHGAITGESARVASARVEQIRDEITHWRAELDSAADAGVKLWSRDDIRKGDRVRVGSRWHEVERVNPKTVSVPSGYSWLDKIGYDRIQAVERDGREI